MTLEEFARSGIREVTLPQLASDRALAMDVQLGLSDAGLLDPPADGKFGPASRWALAEFASLVGHDFDRIFTAELAGALASDANTILPLDSQGNDLAARVVSAMQRKGHWICRHPDCVNIVYVEGMNLDGSPNGNNPNEFNDVRLLVSIDDGKPEVVKSWEATTEPGTFYTVNPLHAEGAARIAFGQYKAWVVGTHKDHEALCQAAPLTVTRDGNKDYSRAGDVLDPGLHGINQHWGYDQAKVGKASAGCLVGRSRAGHRQFMALIKQDRRYLANNGYLFMSTVMSVADLPLSL